MTIYVLKYNNYYNRILKKLDTVNEYLTGKVLHQDYDLHENVSFNPNDGVTTSQVVNFDASKYDYLLVANNDGIQSRWFIIEAQRNRTGQYTLQLQRDIVADHFDEIKDSPVFIEKGTVGINDSAIFIPEDMSVNEIKTKETLLKDDTESAWIALYFAQGLTEDIQGSITLKGDADIDLTTTAHTSWQYYNLDKSVKPSFINIGTLVTQRPLGILGAYNGTFIYTNGVEKWSGENATANDKIGYVPDSEKTKDAETLRNTINTTTFDYSGIINQLNIENQWLNDNDVEYYNNKTIAFSDGVFLCEITRSSDQFYQEMKLDGASGGLSPEVLALLERDVEIGFDATGVSYNGPHKNAFRIRANLPHYVVKLTKQSGKDLTYNYKISNTHNRTEDVPYDIVLLPYNDITVKADNTWTGQTALQNVSLMVAKDIIEKNKGSNKLIDAQIVPYFSEPDLIVNNPLHPEIKLSLYDDGTVGQTYDVIKDSNDTFASFFWYAKKASFSNRITADCGNTNIDPLGSGIETLSPQETKVVIETEKLRICSPNYNGVFEFQPIKAGIDSNEIDFDTDCTYMPQTPYIHVTPVFKGRLYGSDFDDARGLICGGDFSMAQSSDAWETYKAQNKNYQIAFNRQIENIEIQQHYQRIGDIVGAIAGGVQGAAVGADLGSKKGGPYGAAAGAAIGSVVGIAAGGLDVEIADRLRKETLDYTKDQFGYQLGNIKALPDSLVKLPAQVYNNKYFPFVEFYTCTEEEKEALRNKIKYNGMTIMRIGKIADYIKSYETYIKGQLIRSETINCDEHELQAIASELNRGLFMKG